MLFAVIDKIKNNFFPPGSRILCLHTGGLQGNQIVAGRESYFLMDLTTK
jgi:1-aminocyclopropane-1-carboxylate deaminase/D-cysteine desulfhydrase-like pyridoxal-dependent ACC family enzyme